MTGVVEWCYKRAPYDVCKIGTFAVIDNMRDKLISKYLLKRSQYDISYLKNMGIDDLVSIEPEEQYVTLLAHLFCNDIRSITASNIITFIDWMLRDEELYETGLIAYIWYNSCLNSVSRYQSHSAMLEIISNGCDRKTLRFLWDVAKSSDIHLCTIISAIELVTGTVSYLKLVSYLYVCSGIKLNDIFSFISDVKAMNDDEIHELTDLITLYYWDNATVYECLNKGYTVGRLRKYLVSYAETTFIKEGRRFPIQKLNKKLLTIKNRFKHTDATLPKLPKDYVIQYNMWDKRYPVVPIAKDNKTKYEIWFDSLSDEQLKSLNMLNPVVYSACKEGNTKYVEKLLDELMNIV